MVPTHLRFHNRLVSIFYSVPNGRKLSTTNYETSKTTTTNRKNKIYHTRTSISRKIGSNLSGHRETKQTPELAKGYFKKFSSYCQMIADAKKLARRSVLIDHGQLDHIEEFNNCESVERVYRIERHTENEFIRLSLIEFISEDAAQAMIDFAKSDNASTSIPLSILCREPGKSEPRPSDDHQENLSYPIESISFRVDGQFYSNFLNFSELMQYNMMSLVEFKLRLMTLVNFERVLCTGLFKNYELLPFGSSVSLMGSDHGDLDILFTLKDDHNEKVKALALGHQNPRISEESFRNVPFAQPNLKRPPNQANQIAMDWFKNVIRYYMPLTSGTNVIFLSRASVPIIKFTSKLTSLDCDLSFHFGTENSNLSATNYASIVMSDALYTLCARNDLFPPLAIYLKLYGRYTSITSKTPGSGLTNFQFLSLIIFYLQQISFHEEEKSFTRISTASGKNDLNPHEKSQVNQGPPFLPSFEAILCQDLHNQPSYNFNQDELDNLLPQVIQGFFEFYSDFDFKRFTLNLYNGKLEKKYLDSDLHIVNPVDRTKNIGRNASNSNLRYLTRVIKESSNIISTGKQTPLSLLRIIGKNPKQTKKLAYLFDNKI